MLTTEDIQNKYSSLSPDEQPEFKRKIIYSIVNSSYGDRISHFDVDSTPYQGSIASGSIISPRLGGKKLIVDYLIDDKGTTLTPRNLDVIDHQEPHYSAAKELIFSFAEKAQYVPLELYDFAQSKNCLKGWSCGGTCLPKSKKNCHRALEGKHKTYVEWLQHQVKTGAKLHETHQEEANKLGVQNPQPTPDAKKKLTVPPKSEPVTPDTSNDSQKGKHEDYPKKGIIKGNLFDDSPKKGIVFDKDDKRPVVQAMSKISGLSEKECLNAYNGIQKFTLGDSAEIRSEESGKTDGKFKNRIKAINNYIENAPKFNGQIYRGMGFDDTAKL
ncbi:MAG: hypothetical protein PUP93_29000, partial [Rhizonema sp. NSF051]|nr:hypothetical protein [Rhizonema sp. NSF051]